MYLKDDLLTLKDAQTFQLPTNDEHFLIVLHAIKTYEFYEWRGDERK